MSSAIHNEGLIAIEQQLKMASKSLKTFNLPPVVVIKPVVFNNLIAKEKHYSIKKMQVKSLHMHQLLNKDQRYVFDLIMSAVEKENSCTSNFYYLNAPAGTGKTFLCNTLLATIRGNGHIALATATTGVAALLLTGGQTIHTRFHVPLDVRHISLPIEKESALGELIRYTKLIIWDEAPMARKEILTALDFAFQNICGNKSVFGGKVILLCGDFYQSTVVIPGASKLAIASASICNSNVWKFVKMLQLHVNERIKKHITDNNYTQLTEWSKQLLSIAANKCSIVQDDNVAIIPDEFISSAITVSDFINNIYKDIHLYYKDSNYFKDRCILTPKNKEVDSINALMINKLPSKELIAYSIDTLVEDVNASQLWDPEDLHAISPSGYPPHRLVLRIGAPIICLRNINLSQGLCNGARLQIIDFSPNGLVIKAMIICGPFMGNIVLIHRCSLIVDTPTAVVIFKRHQFPVKLAFALTIFKSQGQTFNILGLYLKSPVFSHGALYVLLFVFFSFIMQSENICLLYTAISRLGNPFNERLQIFVLPSDHQGYVFYKKCSFITMVYFILFSPQS